MARTTAPQISISSETGLIPSTRETTEVSVLSFVAAAGVAIGPAVLPRSGATALSSGRTDFAASPTGTALGALTEGKTRIGRGAHAVSPGTSNNAARVTSQTRCRAPA